MDNLFIVMPAYNEEENIETVIEQWFPLLEGKGPESRLVIADSGSTDSTHELLVELQKKYSQLEILATAEKTHGPKVIALYDYAIRQNADYIFQTDSDGQTDPAEFNSFWEIRDSYDAILGWRPVRGDGKIRAFVEKVVSILLKIYFGVKVPDANAPFRLMKTDIVKKYLYRLPSNYNIPNIMITTYFTYYRENITFRAISFHPRQKGKNSINISKIFKIGWQSLGSFRQFKKEMR